MNIAKGTINRAFTIGIFLINIDTKGNDDDE